jgi:UDP-GlcNAc:undecaprenyl-phosphate/decaprenyl-phosphate GlcNAc-1-phosphate transferase
VNRSLGFLVAAAVAGAVSLALTPVAKRIARRFSLVDHPGGHRVHAHPTPVLGGLAVASGTVVATLAVAGTPKQVLAPLGVALALGVVGLIDDLRNLAPTTRLALEAAGGVVLFLAGARTGIGPSWLDPLLVVLWVVAVVNAFNMIDNHDAICSSLGAVACLGAGAVAALADSDLTAVLGFAPAGAAIGFLRWNLPPASIFLGDGGSMFIGSCVAAAVLRLPTQTGSSLQRVMVAALLLLVPFLDEGVVIITRLRERRRPMMASTDHISHRLRLLGASPMRIVATMVGVEAAAAIAAVVVWRLRGRLTIWGAAGLALAAGIALLVGLLRLPHHGYEGGNRGNVA